MHIQTAKNCFFSTYLGLPFGLCHFLFLVHDNLHCLLPENPLTFVLFFRIGIGIIHLSFRMNVTGLPLSEVSAFKPSLIALLNRYILNIRKERYSEGTSAVFFVP